MYAVFYGSGVFTKRHNSTARPTVYGGTSVDVTLKENCGIITPRLILSSGAVSNPATWHYVYIATFNRYYFIDEWTALPGKQWECSCSVDVLATYKTEIGNATKYVTRANTIATAYADDAGKIADTFYSTTADYTWSRLPVGSPIATPNFNNGSYTVVAPGKYGTGIYSFTPANYYAFMSALFDDDDFKLYLNAGGSLSGVLTNIFWLPINAGGTAINAINVGTSTITVDAYSVGATPVEPYVISIGNIPEHPQAASRGSYLNYAPFSRYSLCLPPFGNIEISPEYISDARGLVFNLFIDRSTGDANLQLQALNTVQAPLRALSTWSQSLAVSKMASYQYTNTYRQVSAALNLASGIVGTVASAATGNLAGAAMSVASLGNSAIGMAQASTPVTTSTGSVGSMASISGGASFNAVFQNVAAENRADVGRPLCKEVKINTLSGYVKCLDGELAIGCTDPERRQIESYLTGGFFYE